jgi:hypothetical protein
LNRRLGLDPGDIFKIAAVGDRRLHLNAIDFFCFPADSHWGKVSPL